MVIPRSPRFLSCSVDYVLRPAEGWAWFAELSNRGEITTLGEGGYSSAGVALDAMLSALVGWVAVPPARARPRRRARPRPETPALIRGERERD